MFYFILFPLSYVNYKMALMFFVSHLLALLVAFCFPNCTLHRLHVLYRRLATLFNNVVTHSNQPKFCMLKCIRILIGCYGLLHVRINNQTKKLWGKPIALLGLFSTNQAYVCEPPRLYWNVVPCPPM